MAIAGQVLDAPTKMTYYFALMAGADGAAAIVEAAQDFLGSWSKERIASVQKIDAGWAPFDVHQQPMQIVGALDLRCIRDAIHCHCMALSEAGVALTPELVELDEFFFVASEMIESSGPGAAQARMPAMGVPATPSRRDVFANW